MHAAVPVCIPKAVRAAAAEKLASKFYKAADHSGYTATVISLVIPEIQLRSRNGAAHNSNAGASSN